MTRAQRVLSYTVIASTFYLMAWFSILPVPDVVRDEILPVVSTETYFVSLNDES